MVLWLLGLMLFASAQIAKFPHSKELLVAIIDNNDQQYRDMEGNDALATLLGPKGLLEANVGMQLIATLVLLLGLGACVCLAKGKESQPEVQDGYVRLDT